MLTAACMDIGNGACRATRCAAMSTGSPGGQSPVTRSVSDGAARKLRSGLAIPDPRMPAFLEHALPTCCAAAWSAPACDHVLLIAGKSITELPCASIVVRMQPACELLIPVNDSMVSWCEPSQRRCIWHSKALSNSCIFHDAYQHLQTCTRARARAHARTHGRVSTRSQRMSPTSAGTAPSSPSVSVPPSPRSSRAQNHATRSAESAHPMADLHPSPPVSPIRGRGGGIELPPGCSALLRSPRLNGMQTISRSFSGIPDPPPPGLHPRDSLCRCGSTCRSRFVAHSCAWADITQIPFPFVCKYGGIARRCQ